MPPRAGSVRGGTGGVLKARGGGQRTGRPTKRRNRPGACGCSECAKPFRPRGPAIALVRAGFCGLRPNAQNIKSSINAKNTPKTVCLYKERNHKWIRKNFTSLRRSITPAISCISATPTAPLPPTLWHAISACRAITSSS